jgi:uncharacterized protein
MNSRTTINCFLDDKDLAIVGVSRDTKKFGYQVFKTLKDKGYKIIPVNPNADVIDGTFCTHTVGDIPSGINNLLIVTHKDRTKTVVQEAIGKGIRNIWIQNGCETEEAIQLAENNNIHLVAKACILMYANPRGVHKFHRLLARLSGRYIS